MRERVSEGLSEGGRREEKGGEDRGIGRGR